MIVMSAMLVLSAAMNEKIYDSALSFKMKGTAAEQQAIRRRRAAAAAAARRRRAAAAKGGRGARMGRGARALRENAPECSGNGTYDDELETCECNDGFSGEICAPPGPELRTSALTLGMDVETLNKLSNVVTILGAAAVGAYGLSVVSKKGAGVSKGPGVYTAVFGFAVSVAMILSGVVTMGTYKEVEAFKVGKEKGAKAARSMSYVTISLGAVALAMVTAMVAKKKSPGLGRGFFPSPLAGGAVNNAVSTFFTY